MDKKIKFHLPYDSRKAKRMVSSDLYKTNDRFISTLKY